MIRTSLSCREQHALQRLADGRRVVEAGALLGASAVVLASTAVSVVSIDKHEGYGPSTLRAYQSNLDRYALRRNITPVIGDAERCMADVLADFAFIDLTGEYELTRKVLAQTSASLAAIHDLHRTGCDGVERAIADAGFRIIGQVDTLAICERVM